VDLASLDPLQLICMTEPRSLPGHRTQVGFPLCVPLRKIARYSFLAE